MNLFLKLFLKFVWGVFAIGTGYLLPFRYDIRIPKSHFLGYWFVLIMKICYYVLHVGAFIFSPVFDIFGQGMSLRNYYRNLGKTEGSLQDIVDRDETKTSVYVYLYMTTLASYLPTRFQAPPKKGMTLEFETSDGKAYWSIYAGKSTYDEEEFTIKWMPGLPDDRRIQQRLGFMFVSKAALLAEIERFSSLVEPEENWAGLLFDHLEQVFSIRYEKDSVLALEHVKLHQVQTGDVQQQQKIELFTREENIGSVDFETGGTLDGLMGDVSLAFGDGIGFEEKRTVFLYVIEYEEDEPGKRWGAMLWLLSETDRSAECYVIQTLTDRDGTVQGFSIARWDGLPGNYKSKYYIGIMKSASPRALIERFTEKHVDITKEAGRDYSLIEFAMDYFDSLQPLDPNLRSLDLEQSEVERDVTIYFYTQFLNKPEGSFLLHFIPIAAKTGSLIRHWGIMFEFGRESSDTDAIPERLRYVTISGDMARMPFEDEFTVRLHHGRPDENKRGFAYKKMATTKLSLTQIVKHAREMLKQDLTGNFVMYYNLTTVNCHEWAREFYRLIAERHDLPALEYNLTALDLSDFIFFAGTFLEGLAQIVSLEYEEHALTE